MKEFHIEEVIESKKKFRKELACRPIVEKLRMLDELHDRALTLKRAVRREKPPGTSIRKG